MFKFFKSPKKYPSFPYLSTYPHKTLYFRRIAPYMQLSENEVTVIDPNAPRMITMDPWPQLVFLAADGQRTVEQYIHFMARQYSGNVPPELDETIIYQIQSLLNERLIEFCDSSKRPDPSCDYPKK